MNDDDTDQGASAPRATPVDNVMVARAQPVNRQITVARAQPAPAPDDSQFGYNRTGKATNFGGDSDQEDFAKHHSLATGDPGVGAPALGTGKAGISTANSYGVAVPFDQMQKQFGIDKSNWPDMRSARADVTNNDTGQTVRMPIVDFGPDAKAQSKGVVTDLTTRTQQAWGAPSPANVTIKVLPNAGPDYANDLDGWYEEQSKIHDQLTAKTGLPGIGAEPAPTPDLTPRVQQVAPAVNIMGGYGEGKGSAAEPGVGDDSFPQSSSGQLGGHWSAVNV
jgi:hypothetical protein